MRFNIYASSQWSSDPKGLIEQYPCLNDYNFEIVEYEKEFERYSWIRDENGERIRLTRIEKIKVTEGYVTVDSLDQLMKLICSIDEPIIVDKDVENPNIEIYDTYRE